MKQATIVIALIALVFSAVAQTSVHVENAQHSQSYAARTLVLSNDTHKEMSVCYAYFDTRTNVWTSVGWINIPKFSHSTIIIGAYTTPTFYVHAQNRKGNIWGGDNYFCIHKDGFNIPNADRDGYGEKARFRPIVLNNAGETDYTFQH